MARQSACRTAPGAEVFGQRSLIQICQGRYRSWDVASGVLASLTLVFTYVA